MRLSLIITLVEKVDIVQIDQIRDPLRGPSDRINGSLAPGVIEGALAFFRLGKPTDNGRIGSFNGSFRDECLVAHCLSGVADVIDTIVARLPDCNDSRPHRALNDLAPLEYVGRLEHGA